MKNAYTKLREKLKSRSGAAMIAAFCIMAIFVTFCLAMLLASSVLMNTAQKKGFEEQCRVSAVSMSKELENDLQSSGTQNDGSLKSFVTDKINNAVNVPALGNPNTWYYYNTSEYGHGESFNVYKNFNMSQDATDSANYGTVSVKLYWQWEDGAAVSDINLHVLVTAEKGGESCTIDTVYIPGTSGDDKQIVSWSFSERY